VCDLFSLWIRNVEPISRRTQFWQLWQFWQSCNKD